MFTVSSEEEAIPFLHELNDILGRLLILPPHETIDPPLT